MAYEEISFEDFSIHTDIRKKLNAQRAWGRYEKAKERDKRLGVTIYTVSKHDPVNINLPK
jgi:hypothetical protein